MVLWSQIAMQPRKKTQANLTRLKMFLSAFKRCGQQLHKEWVHGSCVSGTNQQGLGKMESSNRSTVPFFFVFCCYHIQVYRNKYTVSADVSWNVDFILTLLIGRRERLSWYTSYEYSALDHLLLDSAPNLGLLMSRWEINKFENCWYKSVMIIEVLKLLFQQFLNLSSSKRDMSGPLLSDLPSNRWSGGGGGGGWWNISWTGFCCWIYLSRAPQFPCY